MDRPRALRTTWPLGNPGSTRPIPEKLRLLMVKVTYTMQEVQVIGVKDGDYQFYVRSVISLTDEGDIYAEKTLPAHFVAV